VRLIARREDRKVVLHCVAALQNLTYKNSNCCYELLEQGGEKALKKLLKKSSDESMHQYAAGAVANLMLYRRNPEGWNLDGAEQNANPSAVPSAPTPLSPSSHQTNTHHPPWGISRRAKQSLRRKLAAERAAPASEGVGCGGREGSDGTFGIEHAVEAALVIQARYRGLAGRRERWRRAEAGHSRRSDLRLGHKSIVNRARAEASQPGIGTHLGMGPHPGILGMGPLSGGMGPGSGNGSHPGMGSHPTSLSGARGLPGGLREPGMPQSCYSMPPSMVSALARSESPMPPPSSCSKPMPRPTRLTPLGASPIDRLPSLNDATLPPLVRPIQTGPQAGRGFGNVAGRGLQ